MLWFTADLHLGHKNIIGYCARPFTTLDGQPCLAFMHEALIDRWNAVVADDDDVMVVGDFAFGPLERIRVYLQELKGRKHLIVGNHDRHSLEGYRRAGFTTVERASFLAKDVYVVHRPHDWVTRTKVPPRVVVCGHVHEKWASKIELGVKYINVGVDVRGFSPVAYRDILGG